LIGGPDLGLAPSALPTSLNPTKRKSTTPETGALRGACFLFAASRLSKLGGGRFFILLAPSAEPTSLNPTKPKSTTPETAHCVAPVFYLLPFA